MENKNKLMTEKKGQTILGGLMVGFVMVASVLLLLVVLIYFFGVLGTGLEFTKDAQSFTNQSGWINGTTFQLANGVTGDPRDFALVQVLNGSAVIPATNYTLSTTGLITNTTAVNWDNATFTYTYNNNSAEIVATQTGQSDTSKAIPLVGILFVILAIGGVVGVLITSMMGRKEA